MKLFSSNFGLIFKTFLYQIVMSLFGFMMYGATYRISFLLIIGSTIVIVFFHYIMVTQMYQKGAKNAEYDIAHKSSSPIWIGFVFALIAFVPTILLSVLSMVFPPFLANGDPAGNGYAFYLINKFFFQGMYQSIHQWIIPAQSGTAVLNGLCIWHLISVIPGIISCGIGYLVGYLRFRKS